MTPVTFLVMAELVFGDKFVIDIDDVGDEVMYFEFLSWNHEGKAMCSASTDDYTRGFPTGFTRELKVIKIGH